MFYGRIFAADFLRLLACAEVRVKDTWKLIDKLNWQVVYDGRILWEERLKLWLKPRPIWCPERLWVKLVNLVLHQSIQRLP